MPNKRNKLKKVGRGVLKTVNIVEHTGRLAKKIPILRDTPLIRHPMSTMGGLVGGTAGRDVGRVIGHITGSGDYTVRSNSIMSTSSTTLSGVVPSFKSDGFRGTRICHREYIGDVISSSTSGEFKIDRYGVNPGNTTIFPWLAPIAQQYDQWQPNGIVFSFKSTSSSYSGTTQALGTVILATDYDLEDAPYINKFEMENSQYCISVKSDEGALHPIECNANERQVKLLKVRHDINNTTTDQFRDLCNFSVATSGVAGVDVNLGELWVTFDITFYKEQLFGGVYGKAAVFGLFSGSGLNAVKPFGVTNGDRIGNDPKNTINMSCSSQILTLPIVPAGTCWMLNIQWSGSSATVDYAGETLTGASQINVGTHINTVSGIGALQTTCHLLTYFRVSDSNVAATFKPTFGTFFSTSTHYAITLSQISPTWNS